MTIVTKEGTHREGQQWKEEMSMIFQASISQMNTAVDNMDDGNPFTIVILCPASLLKSPMYTVANTSSASKVSIRGIVCGVDLF